MNGNDVDNILENLSHNEKMDLLKKLYEELKDDYYNVEIKASDLGFDLNKLKYEELLEFFIKTLCDKAAWLDNYVESIDIFECVDEAIDDESPDEALTKLWLKFGDWHKNRHLTEIGTFKNGFFW